MSTIAQNLQTIATAKEDIATSVNAKGGNITSSTPLSAYSSAIDALPSGGGGEPDWSEIGYSGVPQSVLDAFDYAKDIYDNWDTGETSMNTMFSQDYQLQYFPLVDTSNVTQMQYTFNYCYNLTNFPLLDTSHVTSFHGTFDKAGVSTIPLICTSAATDMSEMFNESPITSVPLLDTSHVTNMHYMFSNCTGLTSVPQFNTSACTDMGMMFYNCYSLTGVPAFNTSGVTDMSYMFYGCSSLTDIPAFNTSACTNMYMMFYNCYSLTGFTALSSYDFQSVTNCGDMFSDTDLPITTLPVMNTSACTNFWSMLRFNSNTLTRVEGIYLNAWEGGQIFGDWTGDPDADENHPNLTYVMLYNLGMSDSVSSDFDLSCLMDWGDGGSTNHQSLIDSLYTNAFDRATEGYDPVRILLHPYVYARLDQSEIDDIESKGYEVVDISNE